jgi:hypothetical protein
METFKHTLNSPFRAGVIREGREKTQSSQNQATNRNANLITINNYAAAGAAEGKPIDRSAEISECRGAAAPVELAHHIIDEKAEVTPKTPIIERDAVIPDNNIFITEPPAVAAAEKIETELEDFEQNPKLRVIKAKRFYDDKEVVIDVNFLIHVIKVLIQRYHIIICKKDVEEILSYFGTVEIGTKKQTIKTREVEPASCCGGMKNIDVETIIHIIKKIVLNGCNIGKYFPDLVTFLSDIGVNV